MPDVFTATSSNRFTWERKTTTNNSINVNEGDSNGSFTFGSGTGVGDINKIWFSGGIIPSGNTFILDLSNLKTEFSDSISSMSLNGGLLKGLNILNKATGTRDVVRCDFSSSNYFKSHFSSTPVNIDVPADSSISFVNKYGWTVNSTNRYIGLVNISGGSPEIETSIFGSV